MAEKKKENPKEKIESLEQSLIQFLLTKREVDEKVSGGFRRVKGLSLKLDLRNEKRPMFTVEIGMCEAAFDAITGYKERGSCFGIERLIVDWFQRPSIRLEIDNYLQQRKK